MLVSEVRVCRKINAPHYDYKTTKVLVTSALLIAVFVVDDEGVKLNGFMTEGAFRC